jgi:hypothetical protein
MRSEHIDHVRSGLTNLLRRWCRHISMCSVGFEEANGLQRHGISSQGYGKRGPGADSSPLVPA